jgi:hypothetical protein
MIEGLHLPRDEYSYHSYCVHLPWGIRYQNGGQAMFFQTQMREHQRLIKSAASRQSQRTMLLKSGVEWADDAVARLDDDEQHIVSEFHRRKASWGRDVATDEKPREVWEQTQVARTYRISGWSCIVIELLIATITILLLVFALNLSLVLSILVAVVLASVITFGLVLAFHGGITYLVKGWENPIASLSRLKKFFIVPAFALMVFSVVAYVAVQRLDAETILLMQPVLAISKFTAMFGFMVLGTALLVAAELLSWSQSRALSYEALRNERQEILSKRREWAEELAALELAALETELTPSVSELASGVAPDQPTVAGSNGRGAGVTPASSIAMMLLTLALPLLLLTGCASQSQTRKTTVDEDISWDVIIDASGVRNRDGLREAGLNLLNSASQIIEDHHVRHLSVFWFGQNGWSAEKRASLELPPFTRTEIPKAEPSEWEKLRPDVQKAKEKKDDELRKKAESNTLIEYDDEVKRILARLTLDDIVPPANAESPCTDLDGLLSRFTQTDSNLLHIVLVITDGRQNCRGKFSLSKISPNPHVAVIVVIVPGTKTDGIDDFRQRESIVKDACPHCTVVPHYREDFGYIVAQTARQIHKTTE